MVSMLVGFGDVMNILLWRLPINYHRKRPAHYLLWIYEDTVHQSDVCKRVKKSQEQDLYIYLQKWYQSETKDVDALLWNCNDSIWITYSLSQDQY